MDSGPSRLDPKLLDGAIDDVVLPEVEADGMDRLTRWLNDLRRDLWDWMKSATGGEDGWMSQLGDWVEALFSGMSGIDPANSKLIVNFVSWTSVVVILCVLTYALIWLWRRYQPLPDTAGNELFERMREQAAVPMTQLTNAQRPAAIFYHACLRLAETGRVDLLPHSTNRMLASRADLPPSAKRAFAELADAADRALFGGWQPDSEDVARLVEISDSVLDPAPVVVTP